MCTSFSDERYRSISACKNTSDTRRASTLPRSSTIAAATDPNTAIWFDPRCLVEILRLVAFCLTRLTPRYQAELKVDRTRSLSHKSLCRLASAT